MFCDSHTLSIAWRGTDTWSGWIRNLEISKVNWPFNTFKEVKIHSGYSNLYSSIRNELRREIAALVAKKRPRQLSITGHSQGAALATINVLDLKLNPVTVPDVPLSLFACVISSPPVGNKAFKELCKIFVGEFDSLALHPDPVCKDILRKGFEIGGTDVFLKVCPDWQVPICHFTSSYLRSLRETESFIAANNIHLKPSTGKRHFGFL